MDLEKYAEKPKMTKKEITENEKKLEGIFQKNLHGTFKTIRRLFKRRKNHGYCFR